MDGRMLAAHARRLLQYVHARREEQARRENPRLRWGDDMRQKALDVIIRCQRLYGCERGRGQHATDPRCRTNQVGFYWAAPDVVLAADEAHERWHEMNGPAARDPVDVVPVVGWREDAEWQDGTAPPVLKGQP